MNVSPFRGSRLGKMMSGMAKKMKNTKSSPTMGPTTGPSSFLGGLFLGSASGGGGGGGAYTNCKTDDNSFYCRIIRYRSIFSNVLYFVMFFVVFICIIYFVVIPYLFGGKKGRGRKR